MRLPTASRPRLNFFANASLTMATFGALPGVGARELAAGEQRDAERPEVAGADLVEARVGVGVGSGLEALDAPRRCPSCCPPSSGTMRRR